MATIEELESRIKKLEERVQVQEETVKRVSEFLTGLQDVLKLCAELQEKFSKKEDSKPGFIFIGQR